MKRGESMLGFTAASLGDCFKCGRPLGGSFTMIGSESFHISCVPKPAPSHFAVYPVFTPKPFIMPCPKCGGERRIAHRTGKNEASDCGYVTGICKGGCPDREHFDRVCQICGFTDVQEIEA